jgi:7-keto-8-aminopelargonate synthetase-like enzyme
MSEAEPLEQVNRTFVRFRGRTLSYFGGCDYFRLASHPQVLEAVSEGVRRYGLNVAASRLTSGNHPLYGKLERQLARFFDAEAASLVGSGYVTSLAVAQALAGQFSHALMDERAHVALQDAARFLDCPILKFKHRDADDLASTLRRCGRGARPIVLTDGMFTHDGSIAPLAKYLKLLSRDGLLLVDDAHGAGTLGKTGKGAVELEGVGRARVVQCVTLSKAFGVYGGAVLGSRALRARMIERSRVFIGSTPFPLPLANAALASIKILATDASLRRRLARNTEMVRSALIAHGIELPDAPGPIISICPKSPHVASRLKRELLAAGILPPYLRYPGGPRGGYFRFAISSEHTMGQLEKLVDALTGAMWNSTQRRKEAKAQSCDSRVIARGGQ